MDIRAWAAAARRRWWLVLSVVLVALGLAHLASSLAVPQYETSVTFFVTTPSEGATNSYQGSLFSQQRVKSYAALLSGERLAQAVAGEVALTPAQVQARVTAQPLPDTVLLQARVIDADAGRSQRVAGALATHFIELVNVLETPPGAGSSLVKVDVVAGPTLNPVPVSPRPVRNDILAVLLGLIIGIGLAVLREVLDVTVKVADTLRDISGAPVLAVVPFEAAAVQRPLVSEHDAHSGRAEAFRHLRTNLQFVDVDRPVKVIVVTSAVPDEGKSTTAVNLALAFAEAGRRTLLIEADLRRPRVSEYLGLESAVGLSNVLAGQLDIETAVQRWGPHDLRVVASGMIPPNPSELLGSRAMSMVFAQIRDDYEIVIIDTPPMLPVTDAAVVAARADGAVMVTRAGKTSQAQVKAALANLRAVEARVLGCVLNMRRVKGSVDYQYYSYTAGPKGRRRKGRKRAGRAPLPVPAVAQPDLDVTAPR